MLALLFIKKNINRLLIQKNIRHLVDARNCAHGGCTGSNPGLPRREGKLAAYNQLGFQTQARGWTVPGFRGPRLRGLRASALRALRKETTPRAPPGLGDAPPRPYSSPFFPVR